MLASQGVVVKAPITLPLVAREAGLPGFTTVSWADADQLQLSAMQKVSWVYVAVSAIAQNGASVPMQAYRRTAKGEPVQVPNDRRAKVLDQPFTPFLNGRALREWTIMSLLLTGKAYWEVQPSLANPRWIFPIRSDLLKPIPDPQQYVRGFQFSLKGETKVIPPENVFWMRLVHPCDDYDGLSPLGAASLAIATDVNAVRMNLALLKNQARPAGVLTSQTIVHDKAFERLKEQFLAEHGGAWNSGKPLLLENGLTYQAIGLPPKDMEYLQGREFTRDEIYAIYKVPPSVAGVPSANYATADIELRRFWEQAVVPILDQLAEAIDAYFFPDETITYRPDYSNVLALQEKAGELESRLQGRFDRGIITTNEYRAAVKLPPFPNGDVRYMPFSLMPVDGDGAPASPTAPASEPDQDEGATEAASAVRLVEKAARLFTVVEEQRRSATWKRSDLQRQEQERQFAGGVAGLFRAQVRRVAEAVRLFSEAHPAERVPVHEVFSLDAEAQRFETGGLRLMTASYIVFRTRAAEQAGRPKRRSPSLDVFADFELFDEQAREFLRRKAFKFADEVSRTTQEQLRLALQIGFEEGDSTASLVERVQEVFAGTIRATAPRALMIARTEMAAVAGQGAVDGYRDAGVEEHEWLSARDSAVRDEHRIDGERVPVGQSFSNGLAFPGDPGGEPENVINCRCTTVPVIGRRG